MLDHTILYKLARYGYICRVPRSTYPRHLMAEHIPAFRGRVRGQSPDAIRRLPSPGRPSYRDIESRQTEVPILELESEQVQA